MRRWYLLRNLRFVGSAPIYLGGSTDIFLIVVVVTVGGIALFAGYRLGVKDGFQGGVHMGRRIERAQVERENYYLSSPAQYHQLEPPEETMALPAPEGISEGEYLPQATEFTGSIPSEEEHGGYYEA